MKASFSYLLQYIFLLTPLGAHLSNDFGEISRGVVPAHKKNAYLLVVCMIVLGFQLTFWARPKVEFWQFAFYAATIHFAFFNYLLNFLRGEPTFYLANGFFDSALRLLTPIPALIVQMVLLFAGFAVYHFINWFVWT